MWLFNNEEFVSDNIGDYHGFVYVITNKETGRMYIGKKFFWSLRTKPPLKGKKRRRKVKTESDWKEYYGSCEELLIDISLLGKDSFSREILSLHITRADTNYSEVKEQFRRNVLEEKLDIGGRKYYNANIMSKYFVKPEYITETTRRKVNINFS